ncbi:unnamed protein product [Camellia sinensis]|uniref:RING-type domain-containing protein n=1 Tax=Camellia sinensis var. sinensis TaxID=542762 RepID=A0A4S4DEH6_CAMSN|nr:hypothetical protein TEA_019532 [Camellia sinensis var. sinensis]
MGLYNLPSSGEGFLYVLVMNTILLVSLLENMVRYMFEVVGFYGFSPTSEEDQSSEVGRSRRAVSITKFKSLSKNRSCGCGCDGGGSGGGNMRMCCSVECCVCLCGYEDNEEVSELSCKHFFHKGCLQKWFDNQHSTCPLCRSIR